MRTELQIANMALRHIGMNKITSLSGTDPSSVICNDFFDQARDDLFREFPWPFATMQEELTLCSASVTTPIGWDYAYVYPTDAITLPSYVATVWTVFDEGTTDKKEEQKFEVMFDKATGTRIICSNLTDAYCEATYILEDSELWDAKFDLMLSFKLASLICPGLTGDVEKAMNLMNIYNGLLQETKRLAAHEKVKFPDRNSSTVDAR